MTAARFLLLQVRPEAVPRAQELASMRTASGLGDRLDGLRVDAEPVPEDVFDRYAGVLVGGSPYSITDAEAGKTEGQRLAERQLTRVAEQALDGSHHAFFTCFGIGIITRLLGGVVDRTHPERVSAAVNRRTGAAAADPVASVLPQTFLAFTGHKEAAAAVPPGAVLLATNDASPVQLYRAGTVLASQFHPEPTAADFIARATAYAGYGYFPQDELDAVTTAMRDADVQAPRRLLERFVAEAC